MYQTLAWHPDVLASILVSSFFLTPALQCLGAYPASVGGQLQPVREERGRQLVRHQRLLPWRGQVLRPYPPGHQLRHHAGGGQDHGGNQRPPS